MVNIDISFLKAWLSTKLSVNFVSAGQRGRKQKTQATSQHLCLCCDYRHKAHMQKQHTKSKEPLERCLFTGQPDRPQKTSSTTTSTLHEASLGRTADRSTAGRGSTVFTTPAWTEWTKPTCL